MHATTMRIRPFDEADGPAVVALWQACGLTRPWNDPARDIARKLAVQRDLFLVGIHDGVLMASAMAGYDGHRGWVNYLAVHPDWRRQRHGEALMHEVERRLLALGYLQDDVVSLGKRLIADTPAGDPPPTSTS